MTTKDRVILHCDLNSFYASVELLSHPHLREEPVAVGGNPENRHGIILAKNDIAKTFGVQTAETIWQARAKCPSLIILPPHHQQYMKYSQKVNELYREYTDQVEPFGIDESWLDVTGSHLLFGDGVTIADELRRRVREELGLTLSVGVSFNKVLAKLGSDLKKPDATSVISRENFKTVVHPLPAKDLLYVGKMTALKLTELGIRTIGQLAMMDRHYLIQQLGKQGDLLYQYANGLDLSPVALVGQQEKLKSVGNSLTFSRNLISPKDLQIAVMSLAEQVSFRMKNHGVRCGGVQVSIKNTRLRSIDRQRQFAVSVQDSMEIYEIALALLFELWDGESEIRAVSITAIQLQEEEREQTQLLSNPDPKKQALEKSFYHIKKKYGKKTITHGSLLNNDLGV